MGATTKKILCLFLLSLFGLSLFACAAKVVPRAEEPLVTSDRIPPELQPFFQEAEEAFRSGNRENALALYEKLFTEFPAGAPGTLARLRIGEILVEEGKYEKARQELEAIGPQFRGDPLYSKARYALALLASRTGDPSRSELLITELLKESLSPDLRANALALMGDNVLTAGNVVDAMNAYLLALEESPAEAMDFNLRGKIEGLVLHGMSVEELEGLLRKREGRYPSGYVLLALARLSYDSGDMILTRSYIERFLEDHPGHPLLQQGQDLLSRLEKIDQVDRRSIGLILPLSGKLSAYGRKALEAVLLAVDLMKDTTDSPIQLFIEDTAGDPGKGKDAVEKLVTQDRVIGIIGPMAGPVAEEAARAAQTLHVPVITLTQKEGITEDGDFVFRNFLTPPMIMETLVHYAFRNLGMKRFAILYPDDAYGLEMMNLFWNEVEWYGGEIRGIEAYDPKQTDFGREIRILAGLPEEKDTLEKEKPEPFIDFDALFIPDSAMKARLIAPQLAFHDVTAVQLLGTNLWNTSEILQGDTEYLQGALFVDGFFRESLSPAVRDFLDRFYFACGREPTEIEALAFDTMKILLSLLDDKGIRIREDLRDALLQLRNYPGVTGKTSFNESGEAEKELFVLTIRGDKIIQVN